MLISSLIPSLFCILLMPSKFGITSEEDDFYKLLGVEKTADLREIRKAFKNLAVLKHPDKNKDDPDAHDNFVKLAEAYETLKDPMKRNQYDLYGKKGTGPKTSTKYHSYSYYRDQFGIYDDDPLIVTLSRDSFKSSIGDNIWFINFYSPLCSHCHHLAPEWRRLSKLLEGVVKIGAVNCEDERSLCWEIPIPQFPTLLFYDQKASVRDGKEYHGNRMADNMEKFIMSHISSVFEIPIVTELPNAKETPWVLFICKDGVCPSHFTSIKLAAVLKGIVEVGYVDNLDLIELLLGGQMDLGDIILWSKFGDAFTVKPLKLAEYNTLAENILEHLPEAPKINSGDFQKIRNDLRALDTMPWLICFSLSIDTEKSLTLKKLTGMLKGFNIGEVDCGRNSDLCNSLHIMKYPMWGILKRGGAFELYNGQSSLLAIERFALDANEAVNIHALSPPDIQRIKAEGTPWMIGWMLTGCPPCKRMLPALRKASNHFAPKIIQFGTVDCAIHSFACSSNSVNSFPTATLHNMSSVIMFQGEMSEKAIVEFIQTMKMNYVVTLNKNNFYEEVFSENSDLEAFVIDFYVPWCAPCQRLQPEWIKLAQKLSDIKRIRVGSVNCDTDYVICEQQAVSSYPTIRHYPMSRSSADPKITFHQYWSGARDHMSIQKWVISNLKSPFKILNSLNFKENLLSDSEDRTWVVLFFAPWCGYCHQFEPEFFIAVERLETSVVAGKVNCQKEGALCQSENISGYPTVKLYRRVDGKTKFPDGITLNAYTQEALYAEIRAYAANAYITPVNHDEL